MLINLYITSSSNKLAYLHKPNLEYLQTNLANELWHGLDMFQEFVSPGTASIFWFGYMDPAIINLDHHYSPIYHEQILLCIDG